MNETQNQGLGISVAKSGEMAVAAMAAKAKAMVEAKYVIALQRPRKIMEARDAILKACRQEKFAEGARYRKPVGKKKDPQTGEWKQSFVDGFSIRFAETAIQSMRNISVDKTVIYEDDDKRTVHIDVTDLEANITYGDDITVNKTVERRSLKKGQEAVSERTNSNGEKVFIVAATEDEIANKIAAQASKIIRNNGLRLVPQDILADAEEAVYQTLEKGGSDASAEVKKVCDAFSTLNVNPGELEKYLGHPLSTVSKKELSELGRSIPPSVTVRRAGPITCRKRRLSALPSPSSRKTEATRTLNLRRPKRRRLKSRKKRSPHSPRKPPKSSPSKP
jgi:hypothetical protein